MAFGIDKNDYGINRQEWRQFKRDLKSEVKNGNIDLKTKDVNNLKKAIETGNLGAHLDQIGEDMKGILGLHLTGKVDGTEGVEKAQTEAEITEILKNVKLEKGVDTDKVLQYIKNANISRIQDQTNKTIANITEVNAEAFFNSFKALDDIFFNLS